MRITNPQLIFKYGAMGSAKTAHALMTAYNYRENGIRVKLLKPAIDTRDGENIIRSRTGLEAECESLEDFFEMHNRIPGSLYNCLRETIDVLIIDEIQFASVNQIDALSDFVDALGIHVLCYGLKTDFKGNLFKGSKRLMELADEVQEIQGVCSCGNPARFNLRIDNESNAVIEGEQVELGANDRYMPVCRKCYKKAMGKYWHSGNRTVLNLPLQLGDTIYFPKHDHSEAVVERIRLEKYGTYVDWVQYDKGVDCDELWDEDMFEIDELGKSVFLTREAADKEKRRLNHGLY